MRGTSFRLVLVGLVCVMSGSAPAQAGHLVEAEHAPPSVIASGDDFEVRVGVATDCIVGYICSWATATVHYRLPDGQPASLWVEGPYQPFQVLVLTIPSEHIAGPTFAYRIEVAQQSCTHECHLRTVHLPRMLFAEYTAEVVDA